MYWGYALNVVEIRQDGSNKEPKGRKLHLVIEQLLSLLRSQNKNILGMATEYKSKLVTTHQLELQQNPVRVQLRVEGQDDKFDNFDVSISGPTEARVSDMIQYLQSQDRGPDALVFPRFPETLDALNVILGTTPRSKLDAISAVGSARFFPVAGHPSAMETVLGQYRPLLAGRGFFQSTRYGTGRLLLNVNPTHGVFKAHGKLVDIFRLYEGYLNNYPALKTLNKVLSKSRASVQFQAPNGKPYTKVKAIQSLVTKSRGFTGTDKKPKWKAQGEFAGPKDIEFWLDEANGGRYISVYDHYRSSKLL